MNTLPHTLHVPDGCTATNQKFVQFHCDTKFVPTCTPPIPAVPIQLPGRNSTPMRPGVFSTTWLLPSGATLEEDSLGGKTRWEPRTPRDILRQRIRYIKRRLATADHFFRRLHNALRSEAMDMQQFNSLRHTFNMEAGFSFTWDDKTTREFGPQPADAPGEPRGMASLLRFKTVATAFKLHLRKLEEQYDNLPEVKAQREAEAAEEQRQQQLDAQLNNQRERHLKQLEAIKL